MRIQIKDQIDRMKRKKLTDVYDMSGSDEEGGSLDPPTIRKPGGEFLFGQRGKIAKGGFLPYKEILVLKLPYKAIFCVCFF